MYKFRLRKLLFSVLLAMMAPMLTGCQPQGGLVPDSSDVSPAGNTGPVDTQPTPTPEPEQPEPEQTPDYPDLPYTPAEPDLRSAEEMTLVPVYTGAYDQFPSSAEFPAGAVAVSLKDGFDAEPDTSAVVVHRDVVYDERDGEELVLQILLPSETAPEQGLPLIVYVPGSAWMRQNVYMTLPQMTRIAARGYAVAIVEYRGTDVAAFPAQTEDAKTAVRFMRKNAGEYHIDTGKIVLWGDSSGGHTAVMAGITGSGTLDNGVYGEYSPEVTCIVDWYGPTDISLMSYYPGMMDHTMPGSPEGLLIGGLNVLENPELAQKANPLNYITADSEIPPILIMHGSRDSIVPFNQSVRLYEKLKQTGKTAEMYKVEHGVHGAGGFAGDGAHELVLEFIERKLR